MAEVAAEDAEEEDEAEGRVFRKEVDPSDGPESRSLRTWTRHPVAGGGC